MKQEQVLSLLSFYQQYRRILPWREDPTPYHVYISEIMLQQTRVEAVKDYYLRFIKKYPDIKSVAKEDIDQLHLMWQGLGYYSRIKNIQKACLECVNSNCGNLPDDYQKLLLLPGIGDYTAKAILAIAYQKKYVAVDGNLLRIYSRLLMSKEDIKEMKTKKKAEEYFLENIPERPGDYLQALMDLGELVCLPNGKPLCEKCPLSSICLSHQNKVETSYPILYQKTKVKEEEKTILLFCYQDQVLIQKRKETGLLASLYEFVTVDKKLSLDELFSYLREKQIPYDSINELEKQSFLFTHRHWKMTGYQIILKEKIGGKFVSLSDLKDYAFPTAFSYYKKFLTK